MTTSTLIFTVFAFSAVPMAFGQASSNTDGISSICQKARLQSGYPSIPIECCGEQGKCSTFILPGETKYGLTNPDTIWPRRHCSCDEEFFKCITNGVSDDLKNKARDSFREEMCLRQVGLRTTGKKSTPVYEFVHFIPPSKYLKFINRA